MATVVNARDLLLESVSPRVATVTMAENIQVNQSNVTGLGLVVEGTKYISTAATSQVFQVNKDGTISPSSILMTVYKRNLTAAVSLSVISGTASLGTMVDGTLTITPSQLLTDAVTIRASLTENDKTYTDDFTVVKVREGADSLTAFLTNETHTLPSDSSGNVTNYSGASGQFRVFKGALDVTAVCTFSMVQNPDNLTYSLTTTGTNAGNYAVLGGMPTGIQSSTITFRATFGSATLDKIFTVSKARAGAVGQRGSRTFYVPLTGTTATFSDSLATTVASADGGPVKLDTVVQYNDSVGFSQTKFWDGSSWLVVNAVVDGNLLVTGTVGANKFVANLMQSDNVLTRGLTVRATNGEILLAENNPLDYARVGGAGKPKLFRVVSKGASDTQSPIAAGMYYGDTNTSVGASTGRSYTLVVIRRSDGVFVHSKVYDVFGEGVAYGGTTWDYGSLSLASDLNFYSNSAYLIVIFTSDEPQGNRLNNGLFSAMLRNGASRAVFGSPQFQYRSAYVLVGIGNCGEGNGYEAYNGSVPGDTNAWCDVAFSLQNGNLTVTGSASTPRTLADYSYIGDLDATKGAPTGTYVGGTLAQYVETNAANGQSAFTSISDASTGLATKLAGNARNVLAGAAGMAVGSLTWDALGNISGGYGLGLTSKGLIGVNSLGNATFSIDVNGNATFAGALSAATGTFAGNLSAAGGTFSGNLDAAGGTFSGTLSAVDGTFSGTVSAGKVSVGPAGSATAFTDPAQPTIPLQSLCANTLNFNSAGAVADGFGGWTPVYVTGDAVKFKNNDGSWYIDRRIRTGSVLFIVLCSAAVQDYLSTWYRVNGGSWTNIAYSTEFAAGKGTASCGTALSLTISAGDVVEFAMTCTTNAGALSPNGFDLHNAALTVLAKNF